MNRRLTNKLYPAWSFLRLTRTPNLFIIAITQYVTAIFLVQREVTYLQVFTDFHFFLLSVSTAMIAGAGYIINDYYDTKVDYVNRPQKVIVGRSITRRYSLVFYGTLNFFAVVMGFFISIKIGTLHLTSTILLWLHSNQLKRLPLLGNFVIGVLAAISLLIVALFYNRLSGLVYVYAFFAFAINMIREIVKDMEALKGEEQYGSNALPSAWGVRRTKILIYALILFSVLALSAFLYNADNRVARLYFLMLIPILVYFIVLLVRADTQKKYAFLGDFANFIMLTGIISIMLF